MCFSNEQNIANLHQNPPNKYQCISQLNEVREEKRQTPQATNQKQKEPKQK